MLQFGRRSITSEPNDSRSLDCRDKLVSKLAQRLYITLKLALELESCDDRNGFAVMIYSVDRGPEFTGQINMEPGHLCERSREEPSNVEGAPPSAETWKSALSVPAVKMMEPSSLQTALST